MDHLMLNRIVFCLGAVEEEAGPRRRLVRHLAQLVLRDVGHGRRRRRDGISVDRLDVGARGGVEELSQGGAHQQQHQRQQVPRRQKYLRGKLLLG